MIDSLSPAFIGSAVAVLGALTLVVGAGYRLLLPAFHALRRGLQVLDDLQGSPARPGVDARPGLMERMQSVEEGLEHVRHEVIPNGGGSLRDAVDRTERVAQTAAKKARQASASAERANAGLATLERTVREHLQNRER